MKRYGFLYEKIYDIENLKLAHKNARKKKTWYKEVKMIDGNEEFYLGQLQDMLKNKTYKTSPYKIFTKQDGKKEREIFKLPYYPDRVCQWAILQVIQPYLYNKLTVNTFSSIPGRGIHFGLKRLRKALKDEGNTQYCLKIDAKKYYPSINHKILKQKYRTIFKDPNLLWILDEIIDSTEGDRGIPIGNYLSQWSANLYFTEFDRWIKEEKKIKYVFRYMDDIVILHNDKEFLHNLRKEMDDYFKVDLDLKIKENWQIFPVNVRGIDFLGYRSFRKYTLLRKSTAKNFKVKMKKISKKEVISENDFCSINSYAGWNKWCNSYRLNKKYVEPLKGKMEDYHKRQKIN